MLQYLEESDTFKSGIQTPYTVFDSLIKIILQSRTPSVPLNLLTLIHALVQGWKDDGEWPPRGGPLEKSIGRKKATGAHEGGSLSKGVKAVGRVLRLTGTGHGNGEGG